MKTRKFYETGLCDMYAYYINEGDVIHLKDAMNKVWTGKIIFEHGSFWVHYEDDTKDPLEEVCKNVEIIHHYKHDVSNVRHESKEEAERLSDTVSNMLEEQECIHYYAARIPFTITAIRK